jgi:hypothetical protein
MATDAFTIRIFVPDGDPSGVRIIDRMASTGLAITFPRAQWLRIRSRPEFERAGVYVLSGYAAGGADLPTLYIGQGDGVLNRIDSHHDNKDFWNWGFVFVTKSSDSGLNRAHITWLEHILSHRRSARSTPPWRPHPGPNRGCARGLVGRRRRWCSVWQAPTDGPGCAAVVRHPVANACK